MQCPLFEKHRQQQAFCNTVCSHLRLPHNTNSTLTLVRFLDAITHNNTLYLHALVDLWKLYLFSKYWEKYFFNSLCKLKDNPLQPDPCLPLEICTTFTRRAYSLISEMISKFICDLPVSAELYWKYSLQTLPAAELPLIWLCSGSVLLCHHSVLSHCLSPGLESLQSARKQQTVFFLGFLQHSWRERWER